MEVRTVVVAGWLSALERHRLGNHTTAQLLIVKWRLRLTRVVGWSQLIAIQRRTTTRRRRCRVRIAVWGSSSGCIISRWRDRVGTGLILLLLRWRVGRNLDERVVIAIAFEVENPFVVVSEEAFDLDSLEGRLGFPFDDFRSVGRMDGKRRPPAGEEVPYEHCAWPTWRKKSNRMRSPPPAIPCQSYQQSIEKRPLHFET